jgi:hypothetical protein
MRFFSKFLNPTYVIKICNFDGFALKMLIKGGFLYFSMKANNLVSTSTITRAMAYIVKLIPCSRHVLQQCVSLTKDWD